jgi:hypothetical protein
MAAGELESGFVLSLAPGEEKEHLECLHKFYPALCPHYKRIFAPATPAISVALHEAVRKQRVIDGLLNDADRLHDQIDVLLDGKALPASGPRIYDALELYDATLPVPEGFLAGRALCRQSVSLLAGRRKIGKTFLLLKLAAAIVTGQSFGPYATRTGRVLLLSEEMTESELQQRLRAMFSREGVEQFNGMVKIACRTGVKIDSESQLGRLAETVRQGDPDLVLIDALSDIKGAIHENDNDEMGAGLRGVRDLVAGALGCAVLITHHMGRQKEDGSTNARGASAIEDATADFIRLDRNRSGDGAIGKFEYTRHMSPPGDFGYSIRDTGTGGVDIDIHEDRGADSSEAEEIKRLIAWLATAGDASLQAVETAMSWKKTMALYHLNQARTLGLVERHTVLGEHIWALPGQASQEKVPF